MFYDLALDDWYWGVAYKERPRRGMDRKIVLNEDKEVEYEKVPGEIYIEDSRFIFPIADEHGHLGGYEYFCPICYDKIPGDAPVQSIRPEDSEEQKERLMTCQYCGGRMEQTAYVQEVQGAILARFTKDEIIHGSSSRVLPALFGNSRIITVWTLVQTILSMDEYNYEVYSEGAVGAILGLPGYDQLEVGEIKGFIEDELKHLDKKDIQMGRYKTSKKNRTLMMGLKKDSELQRVPIMNDLKDMQSIEFYNIYVDAISGVYGVTPEFVGSTEAGIGVKMKIEVQNRTIKERQNNFADIFNSEVLPLFSITDWKLVFNPVEARDDYKLASVHQTRSAAALNYLRGGFKVSIGPDDQLIVSGKGELPDAEAARSRSGEKPRDMQGKPWRQEFGSPNRTQAE